MKLNGSVKQVAAILGCQTLALGLMVLGAFALAQTYGLDQGAALASSGHQTTAECPDADEAPASASALDLDYLDLSLSWRP